MKISPMTDDIEGCPTKTKAVKQRDHYWLSGYYSLMPFW